MSLFLSKIISTLGPRNFRLRALDLIMIAKNYVKVSSLGSLIILYLLHPMHTGLSGIITFCSTQLGTLRFIIMMNYCV